MQSFYKRFVRDYMRYKDDIHCAGHELINAVRKDALELDPTGNGVYYALHIRRGDLQFKEVKIGAPEMLRNLHYENGTAIIPAGALVYLSTDDPEGLCKDCTDENYKPCDKFPIGKKPIGCPDDVSYIPFLPMIIIHAVLILFMFLF